MSIFEVKKISKKKKIQPKVKIDSKENDWILAIIGAVNTHGLWLLWRWFITTVNVFTQ